MTTAQEFQIDFENNTGDDAGLFEAALVRSVRNVRGVHDNSTYYFFADGSILDGRGSNSPERETFMIFISPPLVYYDEPSYTVNR